MKSTSTTSARRPNGSRRATSGCGTPAESCPRLPAMRARCSRHRAAANGSSGAVEESVSVCAVTGRWPSAEWRSMRRSTSALVGRVMRPSGTRAANPANARTPSVTQRAVSENSGHRPSQEIDRNKRDHAEQRQQRGPHALPRQSGTGGPAGGRQSRCEAGSMRVGGMGARCRSSAKSSTNNGDGETLAVL